MSDILGARWLGRACRIVGLALAALCLGSPAKAQGPPCVSPLTAITATAQDGRLVQIGCLNPATGQFTPSSGGGGTPTPGVFNSSFDPPLFQNYSLTTAGAQSAINLTANPIDTHTISWRPSSSPVVSDAFPYSNGDLHGSNAAWVYQTGTFNVSANVAYSSAASSLAYRNDGPLATANEYAQGMMVETAANGTQNGGPCVRVQTASESGYCIQAANNQLNLIYLNAGAVTVLATYTQNAQTGDILKVQAIGTAISAFRNGVSLGVAITDANLATGATGMWAAGNSNSNGISNFQAGLVYTCNIQLDSSSDGVTWASGGAIGSQSCAYPGSYQISNTVANYVRVNVTTMGAGETLSIVYSGRLAPAVSAGISGVSNGQWVNAGEVIWTQITSQGVGNISVTTSLRILQLNGNVSGANVNINPCATGASSGGVGFGYVVPVSGLLQSVTSFVATPAFPQGTFYINDYLLPNMPAAGASTTACSNAFTFQPNMMLLTGGVVGSFYPVSFVGTSAIIQNPWTMPGYTTTLVPNTPAAGAELTYTFSTTARTCIQSVYFTLAAGSAGVNPTIVLTINGSKLAYTATTQEAAAATQNYSFSPGASAETVTTGGTIFHIVPFNNGQLVCTNAGLSTLTLTTVTTGLNGTTAYTNPSILAQVQQDNN